MAERPVTTQQSTGTGRPRISDLHKPHSREVHSSMDRARCDINDQPELTNSPELPKKKTRFTFVSERVDQSTFSPEDSSRMSPATRRLFEHTKITKDSLEKIQESLNEDLNDMDQVRLRVLKPQALHSVDWFLKPSLDTQPRFAVSERKFNPHLFLF